MTTLIIEDNAFILASMKDSLQAHFPQAQLLATASNATEGMEQLATHQPDLLLLDMDLPNNAVHDILATLGNYSCAVILLTFHRSKVVEAIPFRPFNVLIKPVDLLLFRNAVCQAESWIKQQKAQLQVQQLAAQLLVVVDMANRKEQFITLRLSNELRRLYLQDIVRCEANGNYTYFYLNSGEKVVASYGLYQYSEALEAYGFLKPSQKALVNMSYIKSLSYEYSIYELVLSDGKTRVPVSRRQLESIRNRLSGGVQ